MQPAALPAGVTHGQKHLAKTLKELRADLATATGAEDVPPLKIKRLSLVNIGMLAGILLALAIAIPSLEGVDWATVQKEFENATWGWVVLALRPLAAHPDGVGDRAHGLRQQRPALRPDRAHPGRRAAS